MNFTLSKIRAVLILFFIGAALHFLGLNYPKSVVFDEVHFGKFISSYCCSGSNFFDIHPPHAKLLIAGAAKIGGYDGQFPFKSISDPYGDVPIVFLRLMPALWGILIPIAFFYLLILLNASLPAAFFGGLCLVFENALLLQTRMIALDGLLLLSILCSLIFYLLLKEAKTWKSRVLFSTLAGVAAGFSVGTKFTGLVSPMLLLVLVFVDQWKKFRMPELIVTGRKLIWMATGFFSTYLLGWYIHFQLLDKPGFGNQYYKNSGNFFEDVLKLHNAMFERNASIATPHSDSSHWWQWPTMNNPIYYWSAPDADIYFTGNPFVWWMTTLTFSLLLLSFIFMWRKSARSSFKNKNIWITLLGFWISYLPFILVTRPLFLYHYFTPLLFALFASILWVDSLSLAWIKRRITYGVLTTALLAGFVLMAPVTFGWSKNLTWSSSVTKSLYAWKDFVGKIKP
ncbi:MAG: glycosyltransferase family 39 protein [Bacteriovoracaceae bacterium]|nr:glycosyltransferase family 39 protein [Bacteriovoracaceae bacterium]